MLILPCSKTTAAIINRKTRDVKRNPANRISVLETKFGSTHSANEIWISFSYRKLHKNYQMSGKTNSHIYLMLGVYKSFHQMVKYGRQSNYISQDLTGLEI